MVHIVLTGATGLVGSAVLRHILELAPSNPISKLSILSRSPVPALVAESPTDRSNTSTCIEVIIHKDYLSYPPDLLAKLSDAKAVIWAQGISQTEVSAADYHIITKDFPLAAAKALLDVRLPSTTEPLNFVYVSGEGATHDPGWLTPIFGRVKGETEKALIALAKENSEKLASYCPRPGGIHSGDPKIWQESLAKRNLTMRYMMKALLPIYKAVHPNMLIQTEDLAKVLVNLALREGGQPLEESPGIHTEGRVLQNIAIRKIAGL